MAIYMRNNFNITILILHFSLTLIYAMEEGCSTRNSVPEITNRPTDFQTEEQCVKRIESLCLCGPDSKAIHCLRAFILSLDGNSILTEQEDEYYKSFSNNIDTNSILSPLGFCSERFTMNGLSLNAASHALYGLMTSCVEYLRAFGGSSLNAARHALYGLRIGTSSFLISQICNDESNTRATVCRNSGILYEYKMYIIDNIKLTDAQQSPSDYCKELFTPRLHFKGINQRQVKGKAVNKLKQNH